MGFKLDRSPSGTEVTCKKKKGHRPIVCGSKWCGRALQGNADETGRLTQKRIRYRPRLSMKFLLGGEDADMATALCIPKK